MIRSLFDLSLNQIISPKYPDLLSSPQFQTLSKLSYPISDELIWERKAAEFGVNHFYWKMAKEAIPDPQERYVRILSITSVTYGSERYLELQLCLERSAYFGDAKLFKYFRKKTRKNFILWKKILIEATKGGSIEFCRKIIKRRPYLVGGHLVMSAVQSQKIEILNFYADLGLIFPSNYAKLASEGSKEFFDVFCQLCENSGYIPTRLVEKYQILNSTPNSEIKFSHERDVLLIAGQYHMDWLIDKYLKPGLEIYLLKGAILGGHVDLFRKYLDYSSKWTKGGIMTSLFVTAVEIRSYIFIKLFLTKYQKYINHNCLPQVLQQGDIFLYKKLNFDTSNWLLVDYTRKSGAHDLFGIVSRNYRIRHREGIYKSWLSAEKLGYHKIKEMIKPKKKEKECLIC